MGGSNYTYAEEKVLGAVRFLKMHPNYSEKTPLKNETKVQFTLRCIAHLVSPPMEDDENNEIECVDLAAAILAMNDEIETLWKDKK